MRTTAFVAAALAALTLTSLPTASFADDGDDTSYDHEKAVFAQRRLVMAPGLLRPDVSFFAQDLGSDTGIGLGIIVDWTPIDKLQVGGTLRPLFSPDTDVNDPELHARYLLVDGGFQLAVEAGFTFSDPGVINIGVPLRYRINDAAF
ncbi:MAG: hypothetical protein KDI55_27870, partial [Anaerolineae bacterium]|nr:hypothetical protein [Anaerolineae bacterium]